MNVIETIDIFVTHAAEMQMAVIPPKTQGQKQARYKNDFTEFLQLVMFACEVCINIS